MTRSTGTAVDEADLEERPAGEFLGLVGMRLRESGLSLACIDIQSDCYPVVAMPTARLAAAQRLASESGYGEITELVG